MMHSRQLIHQTKVGFIAAKFRAMRSRSFSAAVSKYGEQQAHADA